MNTKLNSELKQYFPLQTLLEVLTNKMFVL